MTGRRVLLGLVSALLAGSMLLALSSGFVPGFSFPGSEWLWSVTFAGTGAVIWKAQPENRVGRVFLWAGLTTVLNGLAAQVDNLFPEELLRLAEGSAIGLFLVAVVAQLWWVSLFLIFTSVVMFPNGDWPTRVGRWLYYVFAPALVVSLALASPDVTLGGGTIRILPALPETVIGVAGVLSGLTFLALLLLVLWEGLRSGPVRRRQTGWVLWVIGLYILLIALPEGVLGGASDALWGLFFPAIPVSVMVAITRYKLYEIDRIVSRTVSYVVVIGVLGATYAGLVLALRSVVPVEGPLPVALSTLAVAFAFFPLLRRVQRVVDRRFFRSRYDAAGVVASFADELRSTLDPEIAASRAQVVVGETFQAESVSVWLAEEPA